MLSGDTVLYSLSGDVASSGPFSGAVLIGSKLYGVAESLGANDNGMLYSVNKDGSGFQDLHDFGGTLPDQTPDGFDPFDNPIQVGSKLYGTTVNGGPAGDVGGGVIYSINLDGSGYTIVRAYADTLDDIPTGIVPWGGLVSDGTKIYGTTLSGGTLPNNPDNTATPFGTIFSMNPDGSDYTVLHTFAGTPGDDGAGSASRLTLNGNTLYGVTSGGGTAGAGTVYSINTDGSNYQVLHSFDGAAGGGDPGGTIGGAVAVIGSTIIGTTASGGASSYGTIYSLNTDGTGFTVQHSFSAFVDGGVPTCDMLVVGSKVYGTTSIGGPFDFTSTPPVSPEGTLFSVDTDGTGYQLVYTFNSEAVPPDAGGPSGELTTDGTNLYGVGSIGASGKINDLKAEGGVFSVPINSSQQNNLPKIVVALGAANGTPVTDQNGHPIDFGTVAPNQSTGPEETFTISNTGGSTLTLGTVTVPAHFKIVKALSHSSLAPGASDTLTVELDPKSGSGAFTGNIMIPSNDAGIPDNQFVFAVSGTVGTGPVLLPDITGDIEDILVNGLSVTSADTVIPGDTVTAEVQIFNDGAGPLNAKNVAIQFYASLTQEAVLSGNEIPLNLFPSNSLNIAPGQSVVVPFNVQIPQDIVQGNYFLLANLNSGSPGVAESNESNNLANSGKTVPVVLEAGQVGGKSNVTLKFVVPNGSATGLPVTVTLTKGGTATVQVEENNSLDIAITGNNSNSAFTLSTGKVKSGTSTVTLNNVTINNAAAPAPGIVPGITPGIQSFAALARPAAAAASPLVLKSFTAANGVLTGIFEAQGAIQTIKIGEVDGGTIKVDAPPAGLTVAPLVLTIPVDIRNGSIVSAIPIKSLTTIDWIDDDGTPDFLKAPSIGAVTTTGNKKSGSAGDFQAGIAGEDDGDGNPTATTLTSAKIAGSVTGAAWNLTGLTTSIQIGGSAGSAANPLSITDGAIKTLKVGGDLDHARILLDLSQVVTPKTAALGTLTVTGTVNDSSIVSSGNITSATVGRLIGSTVFAGVDTANNAIGSVPDAASDFTPGSTAQIGKLTVAGVKNQTVDFQGSVVAAIQLGTITVVNLPTDGSAAGGVSGETILKYIRKANNKAVTLATTSPIDQLDGYVVTLVPAL